MVWTQCFGLKYFTLVTLLLKVPQVWTCKPSESCEDVIYLERPHDLCVLSFTSQTIASETLVSPTIKPDCEYSDSDFSLQSPPSHSIQCSLLWGFRALLLSVQVFSILYYIILQCLGHDRKTRRFWKRLKFPSVFFLTRSCCSDALGVGSTGGCGKTVTSFLLFRILTMTFTNTHTVN